MISSGTGRHHRGHHKDDQEGRGTSPTAFSPGLSPRMLNTPFPANSSGGRQGNRAWAVTLQLAQDLFSLQPCLWCRPTPSALMFALRKNGTPRKTLLEIPPLSYHLL